MIQYIYFVKCPNCNDEPFDFFDDAKSFAVGCLNNKPVITQTEINRNDFGECTDSCDLGQVWSWEDMMTDIPSDNDLTAFTKADTLGCTDEYDPEFDAIDNSLDSVPDNFRRPAKLGEGISDLTRAPSDSDFVIVSRHPKRNVCSFFGNNYQMTKRLEKAMPYSTREEAENDIKYAEDCSLASGAHYDQYTSGQFSVITAAEAKTLVQELSDKAQQRATQTAERAALGDEVRQLAIDMYNDGTQCDTWEEFEAFMLANDYPQPSKHLYYNTYRAELKKLRRQARESAGRTAIPEGMTIEQLVEEMEENEDTVECRWCNELFSKDQCRYEVDLGWLCDRCQAAIMSRGEQLAFKENTYWDFLDEDSATSDDEFN